MVINVKKLLSPALSPEVIPLGFVRIPHFIPLGFVKIQSIFLSVLTKNAPRRIQIIPLYAVSNILPSDSPS